MPLPETIPVKYSEEEADYLSLRPVVRQTFRIRELVDMILAVTGRDAARVQQVLRSGTTVFHFYRYWWQGFEANPTELAALLAEFPDAQPDRVFRFEECTSVILEAAPGRGGLLLEKAKASRKKFLRRASLWDCVAELAQQAPPRYSHYAYDQRADCFVAEQAQGHWKEVRQRMMQAAPRELSATLAALAGVTRVLCFCPRR